MSERALCTELTDVCTFEVSVYGYKPSLAANAALLAIFAVFAVASVGLGIRYRTWTYMIAVSLGCLAEAIGYAGRLIMRGNPFADGGFITQICCLIIAPAFNSAAIYLVLKHVVLCFGESASFIKARWYTYIFIAFDILSLVLQGAGGGIASSADDQAMQDVGDGLIMAGIAWQVAALSMFAIATGVYIWRRKNAIAREPLTEEAVATLGDTKFRLFIAGVFTAWLTIYIRCVYRIIEMAGGWGNSIMQHESSFIVLEGVMIVIAAGCQTILHPGWGFPRLSGWGPQRSVNFVKTSEETSMEELRSTR